VAESRDAKARFRIIIYRSHQHVDESVSTLLCARRKRPWHSRAAEHAIVPWRLSAAGYRSLWLDHRRRRLKTGT
jgi:hypothetical protein